MITEIQQSCEEVIFGNFNEKDVDYLENPAYVVKEPKGQEGKKEGVGCIVAWNRAFALLTNFMPEDIDNHSCFDLIGGIKFENGHWVKICCGSCEFRISALESSIKRAGALRDIWINSKDIKGNQIVQLVDICIFPFDTDKNSFTLHILFDKRQQHAKNYFYNSIVKNNHERLSNPHILFKKREVKGK